MIRAILTDIEGTTSSISFVKEVLFPYAAQQLPAFLDAHWHDDNVQQQCRAAEQESGMQLSTPQDANALFQQWIKEDKKATPLKALQGMIWKAGYETGAYTAHLYPDTAPTLAQWQKHVPLYVYSSGSIAAQKLFFGYSDAGDITTYFQGYFDTTSGHKQETQSYRNIAQSIGIAAQEILFLSDIEGELNAAAQAGFKTCRLDREGNQGPSAHPIVSDFPSIDLADF